MRYRSNNNLNLKGCCNTSSLNLYGDINNVQYKENKSKNIIIKQSKGNSEFANLKQYILTTFIYPLIEDKYNFLKDNLFNIYYVLETLEAIKTNEVDEDIIDEINTFINIVRIFNTNIANNIYINKVIEKRTSGHHSTLHVMTDRIMLKKEMSIYVDLYGYPDKDDNQLYDFNRDKLNCIKQILHDKPGCYFEEIKEQLQ